LLGTGIDVSLANTFVEAASLFRSRNETADIGSSFNTGIPMPNSPNYYLSEFRESAHQSRFALLAQGSVDEETKLAGYFETDFQSAGTTSNSVQSNSYTLRLRQAYATLDKRDWGTYILGGQAWSLLTLFKEDMTPRQEDIPLVIDAQYVPGFPGRGTPVQGGPAFQRFVCGGPVTGEPADGDLQRHQRAVGADDLQQPRRIGAQSHSYLFDGCRAGRRGQSDCRSWLGAFRTLWSWPRIPQPCQLL
jgi:hypothetical protein